MRSYGMQSKYQMQRKSVHDKKLYNPIITAAKKKTTENNCMPKVE